ncbi:hypothetical protein Dimus_013994 [Dionaea muscipula]
MPILNLPATSLIDTFYSYQMKHVKLNQVAARQIFGSNLTSSLISHHISFLLLSVSFPRTRGAPANSSTAANSSMAAAANSSTNPNPRIRTLCFITFPLFFQLNPNPREGDDNREEEGEEN